MRSEVACPRASRNFATRLACRTLIGCSLRFRARLIVSAGLSTSPLARISPLAMQLATKEATSLMSSTETLVLACRETALLASHVIDNPVLPINRIDQQGHLAQSMTAHSTALRCPSV